MKKIEKLNIKTLNGNYNVLIGEGIIDFLPQYLKKLANYKRVFIISDDNVFKLYTGAVKSKLEASNYSVATFVFDSGESAKCHTTLLEIYNSLVKFNITRGDLIVALGGGVVGDVAGFVASTFNRGMDFIQVPTTLLSMVDSAVGGKTGVNLNCGKNLVGSFCQPKLVLCDTLFLKTLPEVEYNNGMAECVKYGAICDKSLFDALLNKTISQAELIKKCLKIKARIVKSDTFDRGKRIALNFGHTIGHCAEVVSDYTLKHGFAVSGGMCFITELSQKLKLTEPGTLDKLVSCLKQYDLLTKLEFDRNLLWQYFLLDKKRSDDSIKLIIIPKIGKFKIVKFSLDKIKEEMV